jgi:hypothetical protein
MSKDLTPPISATAPPVYLHIDTGSWALFAFSSLLNSATVFSLVFILSSLWNTNLTKSLLLLDSQVPEAVTQYLTTHPAVHATHFYAQSKGLIPAPAAASLSSFAETYELPPMPDAFVVYVHSSQMNTLQQDLSRTFSLALHHLPTAISSQKIDLSLSLVTTFLWAGALSLYLQYLLTNQIVNKRKPTLILSMLYGASKKRLALALLKPIAIYSVYLTGATLVVTATAYFYCQAFMLLPFFPFSLWAWAFFLLVSTQASHCLYLTYSFFLDTIKQVRYH